MLAMMPMPSLIDAAFADALTTCDALAGLAAAPGCRLSCAQPTVRAGGGGGADEEAKEYTVQIAAPGVKAEDLTIEAHGDGPRRLTVRGETVAQAHTHFVNYTVALPEDADPEGATAESADGLVVIRVPKASKAAPARISIALSDPEASQKAKEDEDDDDEEEASTRPYTLTIGAAGIAKADLELSAEAGVLSVRGATARTGASLDRCFRLPRDADLEKATATHVDGLLTVRVPKKAAPVPLRIAVGGTGAAEEAEMEEGVMI